MTTFSQLGMTQTFSKHEQPRVVLTADTQLTEDKSKPPSMENLSTFHKTSRVGMRRKAYDRLSYNQEKLFREVEKSRQKSLEYLRLTVDTPNRSSGFINTMYPVDCTDWPHENEVIGYKYGHTDMPRNSADNRSTHKSHQSSAASYTSGFFKSKSSNHALSNLKYKTQEVSQKANPSAVESRTATLAKTFYKVPYKDFYFQSMVSKKASHKQIDFERVMGLKVENTLKAVQDVLAKSTQLQTKPLMKVMLLVVGFTKHRVAGLITPSQPDKKIRTTHSSNSALVTEVHPSCVPQIVYLERTLSTKTIVDCYVNTYLNTDKYSFGFSPENNKVLVDRIVGFLKKVDKKILLLRCKEHTDLFDRFEELEKYKRRDCSLQRPAVHLLDSSESRLVQHLFLRFHPELRGISETSGKIGTMDLDNMGLESPDKRSAKGKFILKDESSSDDSDKLDNQQEHRRENKSKWLMMIEKCLATKDIMKAPLEEFEGIFDQFVDKSKLEAFTKAHEFRNREGKSSQAITKFRNLLGYQIQEERSNVLQSRGYDD